MGTSFPPICTLWTGKVNSTEAKDSFKDSQSIAEGRNSDLAAFPGHLSQLSANSDLSSLSFSFHLTLYFSLARALSKLLARSKKRAVQAKEDWQMVPVWWEADDFGEYISLSSLSSLPSSSQFNKSPWKVSLDRWILPLFWTVQPWQIWYNGVFMCFVQWSQSFPSCTRTGSSLDNMSLLSPDHRRGNDGVGGKHQGKWLKKTLFYFGG